MASPLLKTWTFKSESNPNKAYETQLHSDNTTSCNCMGWTRRSVRTCKHTRWVEQGVADRYADGVWENPAAVRAQEQTRALRPETEVRTPEKKSKTKDTSNFVTAPKRVVNWS